VKGGPQEVVDLSIVVPVYNSASYVSEVANRVLSFLDSEGLLGELIFVDDGSHDESWQAIIAKASTDSRIRGIRLKQNYGQHAALMCGLQASVGDWVVTLDDDLENPPEDIGVLLQAGREGSDLVFGQFKRERHGLTRRMGSILINAINRVAFRKPAGLSVSNFRLIRRNVVEAVCRYNLSSPYITGLALLHAQNPTNVAVGHDKSLLLESRYSLARLAALTWHAIEVAVRTRLGLTMEDGREDLSCRVSSVTDNAVQVVEPREGEAGPPASKGSAMVETGQRKTWISGLYRRIFSRKIDVGLDTILLLVILLSGFFLGVQQIRQFDGEPIFRQSSYAPAVLFACGKGFANPAQFVPGLDAFLTLKSDTFSCNNLPSGLKLELPYQYQNYYLYLQHTIGALWKVTGVAWSALWVLYGVVFAAALCALYGLLRQVMGPVLALTALMLIASSFAWQGVFPHLYYFIKAPFFFVVIMLLLRAVFSPLRGRRFPFSALILGAVIGLSLGFRRDLLVLIPLCLVVLFFCRPGKVLRNLTQSVVDAGSFSVGLLVAGGPILWTLSQGNNSGHFLIYGLSPVFTSGLGISRSFYDLAATPFDLDVDAITNASYALKHGAGEYINVWTKAYDEASSGYFLKVIQTFPADILLRPVAAALNAVNGYTLPRELLLGPILLCAFLGLLAMNSFRHAILCLLIVLYVSAYPAILFRLVDYFHLFFIPFLIGGYIIQRALEGGGRMVTAFSLEDGGDEDGPKDGHSDPTTGKRLFRCVAFPLAVLAFISVSIALLRSFQDARLASVFQGYWTAPTIDVPLSVSTSKDGSVHIIPAPFVCGDHACSEGEVSQDPRSRYAYLVLNFDQAACGKSSVNPYFSYRKESYPPDTHLEFSRTVPILFGNAQRAKIFLRSFSVSTQVLEKIVLRVDEAACLVGVGRIRWDAMPPVFVSMVMTENWKSHRRHMVLSEELLQDGEKIFSALPR
jgi:hypothetical protein